VSSSPAQHRGSAIGAEVAEKLCMQERQEMLVGTYHPRYLEAATSALLLNYSIVYHTTIVSAMEKARSKSVTHHAGVTSAKHKATLDTTQQAYLGLAPA